MNDIGLIKLNKDIVFGDKVKPIALPKENFEKFNYPATLSGWGTTSVSTKRTMEWDYALMWSSLNNYVHWIFITFLLTLYEIFLFIFHGFETSCMQYLLMNGLIALILIMIVLRGLLQYPGDTPNELRHIQLTVIHQKQCLSASYRNTNNNICTFNKWGEGACHVSVF